MEKNQDNRIVWQGEVDGFPTRIRKLSGLQCVVECQDQFSTQRHWFTKDDDTFCAKAYMFAFLDAKELLDDPFLAHALMKL